MGEAGQPAEGRGCHVVQLLRVPIRSLNVARWAACDAYCPTLGPLQDELKAMVERHRPDLDWHHAAWWAFVQRHGLPGLAFVELDRKTEYEPPPPLAVPIEPLPLGVGHPTVAMLGGAARPRRVGVLAVARTVVLSLVALALLILAAGVNAHWQLLAVMLVVAGLVWLSRLLERAPGPCRWYVVPGGVDIQSRRVFGRSSVERCRPADTFLYLSQTRDGWKVALMPRGTRDVTSTRFELCELQALLAAWQSPLEPVPLERCEIYGG